MKFLLTAVNAKYIHSNPALYSLRACALQREPQAAGEVEIAEYTINQRAEEVAADLYVRNPDVIGFSCYIWNWRMIRELLGILSRVLPRVPVWLGGPEVSFDAETILQQYPGLTGVMVGEGEETFSELLSFYRTKAGRLGEVEGLVFRDPETGAICRTGEREPAAFSSLPFPYEGLESFQNRIVYYESSRGCPYRCSYCLSSLDKTMRLRDLSLVKEELQFFLDRKVPQVKCIDRTFNCNREHAKAIWAYLEAHDNGVTNFHFEIAAELLSEEELGLLGRLRPGLVQLEIGVQSTNEETLRAVRRPADLERLFRAVRRLLAGGNLHVHLDLIAGLPKEDFCSFQNSFNRVYGLRPHQLQLGFLKVLKGSPIEKLAQEGRIVCAPEPPYEVLATEWISYAQLRRLKQVEEMLELYYNSGQFAHVLPVLERQFETPFALYESLADFYREKGYAASSPSRNYRYGILLEFAARADGRREALYRELLTYDLYLRENVKSRPDFAPDPGKYRRRIQAFYEKEEAARHYLPAYGGYRAKQLQRMSHLEIFSCPVQWEPEALLDWFDRKTGSGTETAILFDYQKRSPLDKNAAATVVFLEESG